MGDAMAAKNASAVSDSARVVSGRTTARGWRSGRLAQGAELHFGRFAGVAHEAGAGHRRQVFAQADANLAQIGAGALGGEAARGEARIGAEEALLQLGEVTTGAVG